MDDKLKREYGEPAEAAEQTRQVERKLKEKNHCRVKRENSRLEIEREGNRWNRILINGKINEWNKHMGGNEKLAKNSGDLEFWRGIMALNPLLGHVGVREHWRTLITRTSTEVLFFGGRIHRLRLCFHKHKRRFNLFWVTVPLQTWRLCGDGLTPYVNIKG